MAFKLGWKETLALLGFIAKAIIWVYNLVKRK